MATHTAPIQHGNTEATLGYDAVFAVAEAEAALAERFDVMGAGLIRAVGDLAGSGSDTLELTAYDGVGWAEAMTAMASETEAAVATGLSDIVDQVTLGRYTLAKEVTHTQQILARDPILTIEGLAARMPESYGKTLRQRLCVAGSGLSSSVSATGAAWTFDKEIELINTANETEGFTGQLIAVRQPEQMSDLRDSVRGEANFQFPEITQQIAGLNASAGFVGAFMGIENFQSFDVQQSSGDHVGFAFMPGKFVYAVASTARIPAGGRMLVSIPRFGVVIIDQHDAQGTKLRTVAEAHFAIAARNDSVVAGWKLLSVDD